MILGIVIFSAILIPYLLVALPVLIIVFYYFRKSYSDASRQMKRMDALTRAPVLSVFSQSMEGITVIRSYHAEKFFQKELCRTLNDNTRVFFSYTNTGRWLGIRLDFISACFFATVLISGAVFAENLKLTATSLGLLLSYALQLVGMLQWTVRQSGEVSNMMISTERILEYGRLPSEKDGSRESIVDLSKWPSDGTIAFENLCVKHPTTKKYVLQNISAIIPAGYRVGVVGRTGAGKSSFINALFRIFELDDTGSILIDGLNIAELPLSTVRSKFGIIPQEPFCFRGTFRKNVDALGKHTDAEVWDALERVGLKEAIKFFPNQLDTELDEAGS
jgi:ATP-binding cassette subfamily C (CFTR/MRP) protein 4